MYSYAGANSEVRMIRIPEATFQSTEKIYIPVFLDGALVPNVLLVQKIPSTINSLSERKKSCH